ncbi:hypothetical protein [Okeania sp.]|nr:hypothetical protein [Okeania sp.]
MDYKFNWLITKKKQNIGKQKFNLCLASTIFHDSYQLTIYAE